MADNADDPDAFDEAWYRLRNADVEAAIDKGYFASGRDHYLKFGRDEGRLPYSSTLEDQGTKPDQGRASDGVLPRANAADDPYQFDATWYLLTYPDVSLGVEGGNLTSAHQHYVDFGRDEGRFPCSAAEEDQRMGRGIYCATASAPDESERRQRTTAAWSNDADQTDAGWYWMAHPMVRARLNRLASGDPATDSYGRLAAVLRSRGGSVPVRHAVSLGCGFGGLERGLFACGYVQEVDAYDIAPAAIVQARRLAAEAGLINLRYHVMDFETEAFDHTDVDVVFAHQSVHHVACLDELFTAVAAMLRPGGVFHMHEFVGPDRFQWTDEQIAAVNRFLISLPPRLRALPSGQPRPLQGRATIAAMIEADPSEAVRSSDILPILRRHLSILEERPLGGALLHLGLAGIAQNFDPENIEDRAALEDFFKAEDEAMRDGRVGSDFAVVIAAKPAS